MEQVPHNKTWKAKYSENETKDKRGKGKKLSHFLLMNPHDAPLNAVLKFKKTSLAEVAHVKGAVAAAYPEDNFHL